MENQKLLEAAKLTEFLLSRSYAYAASTELKILREAILSAEAPAPVEWVCSTCGSPDIDKEAWVGVNTGGVGIDATEDSTCFCNQCNDHLNMVELKDFNPIEAWGLDTAAKKA